MFRENFRGRTLVEDGRVEHRVAGKRVLLAPALNQDAFGTASAKIDGEDRVAPSGVTFYKRHTHIERLA
jgi:hypothetical protein